MDSFSERNGYAKPSDVLIREKITPEIQNAICSCYDELRLQIGVSAKYYRYTDMEEYLWQYFLERRKGNFRLGNSSHIVATSYIEENNPWFRKLDLIEKSLEYLASIQWDKRFSDILNREFKRLNFAYRVIDNKIVEITSEEEIKAIEEAITNEDDSIKIHLQSAMKQLCLRPEGDYRNSIKESISAVGAFCRKITGENTLGKALSKLESNGIVLPALLKNAFINLYSYTNDKTTGIRHEFIDDTNSPGADEAIFMLVSCSAFINYLTKKKNGI